MSTDGSKNVKLRLIRNATLGGTPSYADIDTSDSSVEFDTAGTTVTGGVTLVTMPVEKISSKEMYPERDGLNIRLNPGDTLTFAAYSISNNDVDVALRWKESH